MSDHHYIEEWLLYSCSLSFFPSKYKLSEINFPKKKKSVCIILYDTVQKMLYNHLINKIDHNAFVQRQDTVFRLNTISLMFVINSVTLTQQWHTLYRIYSLYCIKL